VALNPPAQLNRSAVSGIVISMGKPVQAIPEKGNVDGHHTDFTKKPETAGMPGKQKLACQLHG
jgi:hypothetical protein